MKESYVIGEKIGRCQEEARPLSTTQENNKTIVPPQDSPDAPPPNLDETEWRHLVRVDKN